LHGAAAKTFVNVSCLLASLPLPPGKDGRSLRRSLFEARHIS
jgi:hypothetical protein